MTVANSAKFPNIPCAEPQSQDSLRAERARATFDPSSLTRIFYDEDVINSINRILPVLEREPVFNKDDYHHKGREEFIASCYRQEHRLIQLAKQHKWTHEEMRICEMILDLSGPFMVHRSMFIPTLQNMTTPEQMEAFLGPALRYEIIGCYSQTELGHGSNVQGLETTATYIPETREFELHSPTLTSSKWWSGGLGKSATHSVVMARLITNGKDYGPHPFVVPIRSLENHRPFPGVTVGDIGPKLGLNGVDNGYVMFHHYRIPHFNMLARFAQVNPETGEYKPSKNAKISYGTMVHVRTTIIVFSRYALARAATIAVRYSASRRQFVDSSAPAQKLPNGNLVETAVLDYTMQQYRLFPVIAQAYAFSFTAKVIAKLYKQNLENSKNLDFSLLPELHATTSGLKSYCTILSANAIEECRRSLGGHGFSAYSGLAHAYVNYIPNVTWEGDNYMISQQDSRYILKMLTTLVKGQEPKVQNPTVDYLKQYLADPKAKCPAQNAADFSNYELVLRAFAYRAGHLAAETGQKLASGESWNSLTPDIHRISRAHCQYIIVRYFYEGVSELPAGPSRDVLFTLLDLYAIKEMTDDMADFMSCGHLTPEQSRLARQHLMDVLKKIRPNAVALVDSFGLPDYFLNSALGRRDGRVYETLTKMVEGEPLNSVDVVPSYEESIRPLVHAGLHTKSVESKL
ncbi:uncharacterized protein VTP21DRAFT_5574 [Calcarisporiella thermophila]|uniref:uncharacterized protein n=1 Tax=Calcarisporiella thermophila TaxID=911321 RepID=UPI003743675F